ncbi:MAG: hypothetical protein ACI4RA_10560, partial [Kiritimatiellia bacterium]
LSGRGDGKVLDAGDTAPKRVVKTSAARRRSLPTTNAFQKAEVRVREAARSDRRLVRVVTNQTGAVIEDYVTTDGRRKRVVHHPPQVWDNAADQLIAMAVSIAPGVEAPPLPTGVSEEEFRRALKKPITINHDDSESLKEIKRKVRAARSEILDEMERTGRGFEEIIREHREGMNASTQLYREALRGLSEVRRNGTAEDVREYKVKMNEALRQAGAKELPIRDSEIGDSGLRDNSPRNKERIQ